MGYFELIGFLYGTEILIYRFKRNLDDSDNNTSITETASEEHKSNNCSDTAGIEQQVIMKNQGNIYIFTNVSK